MFKITQSQLSSSVIPLRGEREYPFVIVITDDNLYLKNLKKQISNFGLVEVQKPYRTKSLKKAQYGDVIIFGDSINYDFRVEPFTTSQGQQILDQLDKRTFVVHDIRESNKIYRRMEKFSKASKPSSLFSIFGNIFKPSQLQQKESYSPMMYCSPPFVVQPQPQVETTRITLRVKEEPKPEPRRGIVLDPQSYIYPTVYTSLEDVRIHDNWVKVGYDQFDILTDQFGRKYTIIDGNTYYIVTTRYGEEYLSLAI